jgi:hypothetical protein
MRNAFSASAIVLVACVFTVDSCGGATVSTGSGGSAGSRGTEGSGGSAGIGGSGGTMGTGGDSGCGPAEPTNASSCSASDPGPCDYPVAGGIDVCSCNMGGGGAPQPPTWDCFTCPSCPAEQPTGACFFKSFACVPLLPCTYGKTTCSCSTVVGTGTWTCGICPTTAPMDGATCSTVGLDCTYGSMLCSCLPYADGKKWKC